MEPGTKASPPTIALVMSCSQGHLLQERALLAFCNEQQHLWMVDDGSDDGTLSQMKQLTIKAPGRIHLVHLPRRQGHAEALRQGMLAATAMPYTYIGAWDATLQVPLSYVSDFMSELTQVPAHLGVRGVRQYRLRRSLFPSPHRIHRYLLEHAIAKGVSQILQLPLRDTQAQAQIYRHTPSLQEALSSAFPGAAMFDATLLARLALAERKRGQRHPRFAYHAITDWQHAHTPSHTPLATLRATASILRTAHQRYYWK